MLGERDWRIRLIRSYLIIYTSSLLYAICSSFYLLAILLLYILAVLDSRRIYRVVDYVDIDVIDRWIIKRLVN